MKTPLSSVLIGSLVAIVAFKGLGVFVGLGAWIVADARAPTLIAKHAAEADATLQAIYEYKARKGLWPYEVTAQHFPGLVAPSCNWKYHYLGLEAAPILTVSAAWHCFIEYRFPDHWPPAAPLPEWQIRGESRSGSLPSAARVTWPLRELQSQVVRRKITELDRRVHQNGLPTEISTAAARALIALLLQDGDLDAAIRSLGENQHLFPAGDPWHDLMCESLATQVLSPDAKAADGHIE